MEPREDKPRHYADTTLGREALSVRHDHQIPFAALILPGEIGVLLLDGDPLLIIAGLLAVADAGLFLVSRATFCREEILTEWK